MQQNCEAVFENGILRPLVNLKLKEGQPVRLIIEETTTLKAEEMLKMAFQVYEGLSEQEIDKIEEIACNRSHFFTPKTSEWFSKKC